MKPEILHELVRLVTKEPSSDTPDAIRFKYNNIAAELFACDVASVNDAIVSEESFLRLLNNVCSPSSPLQTCRAF